MIEQIVKSLADAEACLRYLLHESPALKDIEQAARLMSSCLKRRNRIYSCGNGGSMCDAMHFAEELSGRYRKDRAPLGAMAISDVGHMTCVSNDYGYAHVFSRFLAAHAHAGDTLLAISTSGTSENVLNACRVAKELGMHIVGLTGKYDTPLTKAADVSIVTLGGQYADRVQELHIKVIHILIELIETELFGSSIT
jgi:D-sedoheptulose 7-phosphate isomerase